MTNEVPIYDGAPKRAAFDSPDVLEVAESSADSIDGPAAPTVPLTLPRPASPRTVVATTVLGDAGRGRVKGTVGAAGPSILSAEDSATSSTSGLSNAARLGAPS